MEAFLLMMASVAAAASSKVSISSDDAPETKRL
jgi:hypothetical protein